MTTRRWMIAVAVVALLLGGGIGGVRLKRRHDLFVLLAQSHAETAIGLRGSEDLAREALKMIGDTPRAHRVRSIMARIDRRIAYNESMARKYRHAARYPWIPVEPDPPEAE
jgi:hypothetical protein